MTQSYSTRQMLRVRNGATAVLFVLAFGGQRWREQPGGRVTHAVVRLAGVICPGMRPAADKTVTVAGGAHALDMAALHRLLGAVTGSTRCKALVPTPGARQ